MSSTTGSGSCGGVKTTAGALPGIGGNIQQAFRGLRALLLHEDFAEGSFSAFQL